MFSSYYLFDLDDVEEDFLLLRIEWELFFIVDYDDIDMCLGGVVFSDDYFFDEIYEKFVFVDEIIYFLIKDLKFELERDNVLDLLFRLF